MSTAPKYRKNGQGQQYGTAKCAAANSPTLQFESYPNRKLSGQLMRISSEDLTQKSIERVFVLEAPAFLDRYLLLASTSTLRLPIHQCP
jgi:hypothetical protein